MPTPKKLAVLAVALSIVAVAFAIDATLRAGAIEGPSGLVVTPHGEVWIGVDDELWRASADGRLIATADAAAIGLPGPPANLVRHPGGAIVATVRDDPTLYFLDASTTRPQRALRPQWPADLERHGARAINLAFHADGRFAVATGGGHAVALFDADGRFLRRTAPGTYRFTNGVWWSGDALWTTDTNRFALHRLDGTTLAVQQTIDLSRAGVHPFLGPARRHPGAGAADAPMAALVQFTGADIMTSGDVAVVFADGRQAVYPHAARLEPRDLDWLGGDLLVSDGVSHSVLRWSAARKPLPAFGDAALQQRLAAGVAARDVLQHRHRTLLALAIALLVGGGVIAAIAEHAERRARTPIDVSRLGTPRVSWHEQLRLALRLYRSVALMAVGMLLLSLLPRGGTASIAALVLMVLLTVGILLLAWLDWRRIKRLAQDSAYEPLLNAVAVRKLVGSSALAAALRAGEQVRETLMLQGFGPRWLVLTDQRLLLWQPGLTGDRLVASRERADIVAASTERGSLRIGEPTDRLNRPLASVGWIEIAFADGTQLAGGVNAPTVARRIAEQLRQPVPRPPAVLLDARVRPPARDARRKAYAVVASALVPGLGQWLQRRNGAALAFFLPWLLALFAIWIPLAWALAGPRAEIGTGSIATATALLALLSVPAAWDAWRAKDN